MTHTCIHWHNMTYTCMLHQVHDSTSTLELFINLDHDGSLSFTYTAHGEEKYELCHMYVYLNHVTCMCVSHVTYMCIWVMSHVLVYEIYMCGCDHDGSVWFTHMAHGEEIYESCHIYVYMSHVTCLGIWDIYVCMRPRRVGIVYLHGTWWGDIWVMSHIRVYESCHMYVWVSSHIYVHE